MSKIMIKAEPFDKHFYLFMFNETGDIELMEPIETPYVAKRTMHKALEKDVHQITIASGLKDYAKQLEVQLYQEFATNYANHKIEIEVL